MHFSTGIGRDATNDLKYLQCLYRFWIRRVLKIKKDQRITDVFNPHEENTCSLTLPSDKRPRGTQLGSKKRENGHFKGILPPSNLTDLHDAGEVVKLSPRI